MANYVLSVLGIVVSVSLFLIGYRQTIGARKERAAAANAQVERIVVRLIATEDNFPSLLQLERLIQGKAIDNKISPDSLYSAAQMMVTVYARISESDLIAPDRRHILLKGMESFFGAIDTTAARPKYRLNRLKFASEPLVALALIASALGAIIATIPSYEHLASGTGKVNLRLSLVTVLGSLLTISFTTLYLRLRSSQSDTASSETESRSPRIFEQRVLRILNRLEHAHVTTTSNSSPIDYVIRRNERKIGIIARYWVSIPSSSYLRAKLRLWLEAGSKMGLDEIVLVVPDESSLKRLSSESGIRATSLDNLSSSLD